MRIKEIGAATLINADCREAMRAMDENSVDAIVTDPPYGIGFMGKSWDSEFITTTTAKRVAAKSQPPNPDGSPRKTPRNAPSENAGAYDFSVVGNTKFQLWTEEWAREALRVLKPGGHLIVFSGPRTYHRMVCGIEDAGFEIRDQIFWTFGSGFPKSKNLDGDWEGWGTNLKPAHEPICVARKPLAKGMTVAANVQQHGTGAINIDGCRIDGRERTEYGLATATRSAGNTYGEPSAPADFDSSKGRWPANLIHDNSDEVLALFPDSNGSGGSLPNVKITGYGDGAVGTGKSEYFGGPRTKVDAGSGSAARFFYSPKCSKRDRNSGLDSLEYVIIEWSDTQGEPTWGSAECQVKLLVDTEQYPLKVIGVSGTHSRSATEWDTLLFGSEHTALSPRDTTFTIETELSSTTGSATLSYFRSLLTSVNTQGASCATENGGNPARTAENGTLHLATTSATMASVLGAGNAALPMRLRISASAAKSGHPTVKPTELMRYLCRLVTPPGGTVLDPFMGSGSTGKAALKEGFGFVGIELDEEHGYFDIACARVRSAVK